MARPRRPAGGAAAIAGFAYQLLGSIDWAMEVVVHTQGGRREGFESLTVTFEPTTGGDAMHERDVVQFKVRSKGGWTDHAIVAGVFPDLLRAARTARPGTTYRLQTDAPDRRSTAFRRLQALLARDGLKRGVQKAVLEGLRFCGPERRPTLDAGQFLDWVRRTTTPKDGNPAATATILRLLSCFSVTSDLAPDRLIARIDERLARVLPHPGRAAEGRRTLLGHLVELAQLGDARCSIGEMLHGLGLPVADLASNARLEAALAARLARDLELIGYTPAGDARATDVRDTGEGPLVFGGPSGVGKTWLVARAAAKAQRDGALVVWLDAPGTRAEVQRMVADRIQAARGIQDRDLNPQALGEVLSLISTPEAPFRLLVCLDRFRSLPEAAHVLTDPWWDEQGIAVAAALPATIGAKIHGLQIVEAPGFSALELRSFLQSHGRHWADVSHDVLRLISRPSLARLYLRVAARSPRYAPDSEYELVRAAWSIEPMPVTPIWRAARAKLMRAATAVLKTMLRGKDARYPWPIGGASFSVDEVECLERVSLLRWADDDRVLLDHDRLLAWALAAAAADLIQRQQVSLQALADLLTRTLTPGGDLAGVPRHAVAYFPLDLLWHLTAPNVDLAPALTILRVLLNANRGFEWSEVATLGPRALDLLLTSAETFGTQDLGFPAHLGTAIAAATPSPIPRSAAQRQKQLLASSQSLRRRVALRAYERRPQRGVLRRLIAANARARVAYFAKSDDHDAYAEWDRTFPAARAAALAYPGEFRAVLKAALTAEEARTVGWLIMEFPPAEAKLHWRAFTPHLEKIEPGERARLAASAARLGGQADLSARVSEGIHTGEYAFELLACVEPAAAQDLLRTVTDVTARAAVGGLEMLARTDPAVDQLVADIIHRRLPCREVVWEMGPWAAVAGPQTWRRLIERADLSAKNSHELSRFADTASLALLPELEAQAGRAFEARVDRIAANAIMTAQGRHVDSQLEAAEEILLRIGGKAFARQGVRRLSRPDRLWNEAGIDMALVSDAPALRTALRRFMRALWEAGPPWRVPIQPLSRFAACDPQGAKALARELLEHPRADAATYAGHLAQELDDRRLALAALKVMRGQRGVPLRQLVNLSAGWEDDPKALVPLARRALRSKTAEGRYYAAWIGRHLGDKPFQRRVLAQLLPVIRHRAESSDRSALAVLMEDPDLRAEYLEAMTQEPPNSLLPHLFQEVTAQSDWNDGGLEESMIDAALQFENGFLNTPREGQEKLLKGQLEVGLEVFAEGLRRGGRASEGLSADAIRHYPTKAPALIIDHLLDIEDEKVKLNAGRALRGADWALVIPLITERLRSEDFRTRLSGLEAAGWFPDLGLEALVLDIRRWDTRGSVQKAARNVLDRWDVLRFISGLAARLPQRGEDRRRMLAIMSGADRFSVMRTPADPLHVDSLDLDLRERHVVAAFKPRRAA